MKIKNKLPFIGFVLVLKFCCLWQIYSICEHFFRYPTVILSETTFDVSAIPFPSMTFCTYIENMTIGKTSEELFENFNVSEIVSSIYYGNLETGKTDDISYQANLSLSNYFKCFTLNHLEQGNFNSFLYEI